MTNFILCSQFERSCALSEPLSGAAPKSAPSVHTVHKGLPDSDRAARQAARLCFQDAAYGAPEAFHVQGHNMAAVIFVNEVDGDRSREIDQIGGAKAVRPAQPI
jgi:hypothetical protein